MNIKFASLFVIILMYLVFPPSFSAEKIPESDHIQIEFSSNTVTKATRESQENFKLQQEISFDQIQKIRFAKFLTLMKDINKIDQASFSDPIGKILLNKQIEKIKPKVNAGNYLAVYSDLLDVKTTIGKSIKTPASQQQANKLIDEFIESIRMQNGPLSLAPTLLETIKKSPLKQFKIGLPIEKIVCKNDLVLLMKTSGEPGCFKITTAQKVIQRGWGTKVLTNSISQVTIEK